MSKLPPRLPLAFTLSILSQQVPRPTSSQALAALQAVLRQEASCMDNTTQCLNPDINGRPRDTLMRRIMIDGPEVSKGAHHEQMEMEGRALQGSLPCVYHSNSNIDEDEYDDDYDDGDDKTGQGRGMAGFTVEATGAGGGMRMERGVHAHTMNAAVGGKVNNICAQALGMDRRQKMRSSAGQGAVKGGPAGNMQNNMNSGAARGKIQIRRIENTTSRQLRIVGAKVIDLWLEENLYSPDPTSGATPPLTNIIDLVRFIGNGFNNLLGYCGRLHVLYLEEIVRTKKVEHAVD
ncbi:hypothetical protein GOP47_0010326 [Adiantum capillus-veneris]|uniref:Uncharacterized protein n=1 Tax=Adiantum capillus-veneris TaxID=13818 RepID=A0A9D4ZIM8_ADICA|nr:hypothetical protein GOP47_0010326 [Adiantum capillus-veneris]